MIFMKHLMNTNYWLLLSRYISMLWYYWPWSLTFLNWVKYGISCNEHKWFTNYLSNRKQVVSCHGELSKANNITVGVPQGSVLGPLLFILFADYVVIIRQGITSIMFMRVYNLILMISLNGMKIIYFALIRIRPNCAP